jgi:uncharacterized phiE125 gp8 family phage protein
MALPGFPDGPGEQWWRIEVRTPPAYAATGDLAAGSPDVANFSAAARGRPITPLPGQLVAGPGIPTGAAVVTASPPTSTGFTMSLAATATTPGAALAMGSEPVTLADAKQWARIQYSVDDNLVTRQITRARNVVERTALKQALLLQSRTLYTASFPWGGAYGLVARGFGLNPWWFPSAQGVIQLPYPPLVSVDSIQYADPGSGQLVTMNPASYLYSADAIPGRLQPVWGTVWPIARPQIDAVQITFTCGYGPDPADVPDEIVEAMCMLIAASYRNREADAEYELHATRTFKRAINARAHGHYS